MKIQKREIKKHLFVCTNSRPCGDDCASKDALEIVATIKKRLRDEGLWENFKVSKSGCLGGCAFGTVATLYPDNLFFTEVSIENIDEIYELLTK
ncbi:MAG: (2Fe-2S) ferredoxin domain-containing protein [Bdellovibrionota bacterium]|nr:(2Fe-2S) ferredoxin domain-containing protein [Bdellovibrionota bacterium]